MQTLALIVILLPMETETAAFDTHDFVKRLTNAGMPEAQAEILAWGQSRRNEHLADKRDIRGLEARIKEVEARIKEVEARIKEVEANIKEVEANIKALEVIIRQIEADLKQELKEQRIAIKEQEAKIKSLELAITKQEAATRVMEVNLTHSLKEMEHKLIIRLGVLISAGITILATLIKFS